MTKPLVLGAICVCMAAAAEPRQTVDPLEDLFARGRAAQASVSSLSASFIETTVSSLLRDPIVESGTLVAAMPVRVIMRYSGRDAKIVLLDDKQLIVAWPGRGARERLDITATQRRVQKYFVEASTKELRESFDMTVASDARLPGAYLLDMAPKRKQIKEGIERLRLWIDRQRLVMVKMRLDYPGGDSKTLELDDIRLNVPIDASTFALPGGGRRP